MRISENWIPWENGEFANEIQVKWDNRPNFLKIMSKGVLM